MSHQALLSSLKAEADTLQALLEQLRWQQQAMLQGHSQEVLQSSQGAESLIKELQAASLQRQELQQGWDSLESACESSPDLRTRTQFKACLQQVQKGFEELARLRYRNQALIEQGLQWVDGTLSSFVDLGQQGQPAIYGGQGTESNWKQERSICDYNA